MTVQLLAANLAAAHPARSATRLTASSPQTRLLGERRKRFAERYVEPLVAEAGRLGIDANELVALIREASYPQGGTTL